MPSKYQFDTEYQGRFTRILQIIRIDPVLLFGLLILTLAGLGSAYQGFLNYPDVDAWPVPRDSRPPDLAPVRRNG